MSNVPDTERFTIARWPRLAQAGRGGDVPGIGLRFPLAIAYVQGRLTPSGVAAIEALMALDDLARLQVAAAAADHRMHLLLPRLVHRAAQSATSTIPVRGVAEPPARLLCRRSSAPAPSEPAAVERDSSQPFLRSEPDPDQPAASSGGGRLAATPHARPTVRRKKPRADTFGYSSLRSGDDKPPVFRDKPTADRFDYGSPRGHDDKPADPRDQLTAAAFGDDRSRVHDDDPARLAPALGIAGLERCARRFSPAVLQLAPLTDSPAGQPWRCELPGHEGLACSLRVSQGDLLAEVEGPAPSWPGARPALVLFGPDGLVRFDFTLRPLANGRYGDVRLAGPWPSLAQRLGHGPPLALWLDGNESGSDLFHSLPVGPPPADNFPRPPLL